jgi:hypothetical protein
MRSAARYWRLNAPVQTAASLDGDAAFHFSQYVCSAIDGARRFTQRRLSASRCADYWRVRNLSNSSPGSQFTVPFCSRACQPNAKPNLAIAALLEKSIAGEYSSPGLW